MHLTQEQGPSSYIYKIYPNLYFIKSQIRLYEFDGPYIKE